MKEEKIYDAADLNISFEQGRLRGEKDIKDALLEWAKERMGRLEALYKIVPSSAIAGRYDAMKELIEKIEPL